MSNPTVAQKIQEAVNQLNQALLQKDMLSEQLEQANERVKALRNLLAGVDLGRQMTGEATPPVTNAQVD